MRIFIPTRGRVGKQITLRSLPESLRQRTWLVVPREEAKAHEHHNILVQPASITTIAEKRAWIFKQANKEGVEKITMLDDDMGFYARGPKGLIKEYATVPVLENLFGWIEQQLDDFAHVGISSRMGNNHVEEDVKRTTRMMHALSYHVPTAIAHVKFNRVAFREDFDYTLQLLRKGYDNIVRYDVCVAPGAYGSKGGCFDERNVEKSNLEAEKLADLHPGLVKVVDKNYDNVPRKEVVVQWRRALGADL